MHHNTLKSRMRIAVLVCLCLLSFEFGLAADQGILISEFLASNIGGLLDQDGDASDWLEVQNSTPAAVDLGGWHLTDDAANLSKWTFPATTVGPGKFLLIFASAKNRAVAGAELHTNFQLTARANTSRW